MIIMNNVHDMQVMISRHFHSILQPEAEFQEVS